MRQGIASHPGREARPESLERGSAIALAAGRLAIGAGIWLAPEIAAKALGLGSLDGRALALGRIAASRDLVIGAWQLRSLDDPGELRRATTAAATTDAGDVLTFALALAADDPGARSAGRRGLAGAAAATLAGIWLAGRLRVA